MGPHLSNLIFILSMMQQNFQAPGQAVGFAADRMAELTKKDWTPPFAIHGFWQHYHLLHFSSWTQVEIYLALYFGFSCFPFTKLKNKIILLLEGSCAKSLPRATGLCRHKKVEQLSPGHQRLLVTEMPEVFLLQGCLLCRVMWDLLANSSFKDPSVPSAPELSFL